MVKDIKITLNVSHLILGAIILFLLWLLLKPVNVDLSKYDKQKREIDSLSQIITGLQKEQKILDESILKHQNKIDSLDNEIDTTNQEIENIRAYYGKKIRDIANYTPSQLNDFFSSKLCKFRGFVCSIVLRNCSKPISLASLPSTCFSKLIRLRGIMICIPLVLHSLK